MGQRSGSPCADEMTKLSARRTDLDRKEAVLTRFSDLGVGPGYGKEDGRQRGRGRSSWGGGGPDTVREDDSAEEDCRVRREVSPQISLQCLSY